MSTDIDSEILDILKPILSEIKASAIEEAAKELGKSDTRQGMDVEVIHIDELLDYAESVRRGEL